MHPIVSVNAATRSIDNHKPNIQGQNHPDLSYNLKHKTNNTKSIEITLEIFCLKKSYRESCLWVHCQNRHELLLTSDATHLGAPPPIRLEFGLHFTNRPLDYSKIKITGPIFANKSGQFSSICIMLIFYSISSLSLAENHTQISYDTIFFGK